MVLGRIANAARMNQRSLSRVSSHATVEDDKRQELIPLDDAAGGMLNAASARVPVRTQVFHSRYGSS